MRITNYAIRNYQFTLIMVLMVSALGISTILNMSRAEDPSMEAPSYPVIVIYPGSSPKDIEEWVVKPLEQRIYGLDKIKKIRTVINDGLAVLLVDYSYDSNVDDKYQELVREVNSMRGQLPEDIYSIEVEKVDPSNVNILQMALISENAARAKLKTVADDLQDALEKIPGLKNVKISGLPEQLVRVDVQLEKAAASGIPLNAIASAIQNELANIPGGSINEGNKAFNIKTGGNINSLEEVQQIIVSAVGGSNIFLKDIANVYFDYAPEKHIVRQNGYRAVSITAEMKAGGNITEIQQLYLPVINGFKEKLPANIDLLLHFDQADNVNQRLKGLGVDFLIAIGLVLLTLLPLGTRASFVVMLSIPLSLAMGVMILNVFGYSLNQLSIVGFVVALGLLVDDSIVVVENIERWMREGHSRLDAAMKATAQIGKAVLGCTATLMIAFMPLLFLPESSGDFIRSLPVAVIGTVFASMIVALTVVPFFSSKILKPHAVEGGNIFLQTLQRFIHSTYAPLLDKALKHPWATVAIAVVVFGASLLIIPVIGFSLFPSSEKPQFLVNVTTPLQSNIYYTDSITKELEKELKRLPEVQYFTSNTGKGNPVIYYNVAQKNEQSDFAEIFVQLKRNVKAGRKREIIESLRQRWSSFEGAKVEVKDFEQGQPMISPVEVRLLGDDLDSLRSLAAKVELMLQKTKGTIYVKNNVKNLKSDIRVQINKEKAQAMGVPTAQIGRTVRMGISGMPVGKLTNPGADGDDYTLLLTTSRPSYPDLRIFDNLYVNNVAGQSIPISQLTTLQLESSPVSINHFNKVRTVSVTSFVQNGYLNDNVIKDVMGQMAQFKMPIGYSYEMGGELEGRNDSFQGFQNVILVTAFMFIAVLVLQFGTFKSTLIVLSVIPLGIVGAALALLVTGNSLSFVATIGIIALAGIEVKNTILLVDFTNELRQQGLPLIEAIEKAGEARFLPIILTSLTAIGGLLPIALSDNPLISPLAIVMIGGLISSTLLSRVVTPVVYKLMPPKV